MKKALFFLFVLVIVACSSDCPTSSSHAYDTANGEWEIILDGESTIFNITSSEDYCYFLGYKYNGLWVGNVFTGSCVFNEKGVHYSYLLKLNVLNNNSLEGHLHGEITIEDVIYYNDADFTATRT